MLRIKLPDWKTECILVTELSELPQWGSIENLYLDLETTSGEDKLSSTNPWHNCKLLGIAICVDDEQFPYYIPVRHRGPNTLSNLPYENVKVWLQDVLSKAKTWINHNIKYDANVLLNEGFTIPCTLVDSLVMCKLAPMEERFNYGLTEIMSDWFFKDISPYEEKLHLNLGFGCKDYGLVPIDIMAPYAAVDTLCVRHIYKHLKETIPEECKPVVDLELELTSVLLNIEREGMSLNMDLVEKHSQALPVTMFLIEKELAKLTGYPDLRPHTNADCKMLVVDKYGLPILEWTDKRQPSFSKDALLGYRAMRPDLTDVFNWLLKYRELHTLCSLFTTTYKELNVNGKVHGDFNQIVRTGRMSMRKPNMEQLSDAAKEYIVPSAKDRVIVDIDFSQIEYRLIAHFVKAEHILKEYATNPKADYHQVVADICGISRKEAKRVNFCLSYGGSRGKVIEILSGIAEVIERCGSKDNIEKLGNGAYGKFHKAVPTLKPTSYNASHVMRTRGYVRTIMKRRRYLPRKAHFKSFNTVIQGSAADLFKAAMLRLYKSLNEDTKIVDVVHDSFVLDMPAEQAEKEIPRLVKIIEQIPEGVQLRVPIRADYKVSNKCWRDCR